MRRGRKPHQSASNSVSLRYGTFHSHGNPSVTTNVCVRLSAVPSWKHSGQLAGCTPVHDQFLPVIMAQALQVMPESCLTLHMPHEVLAKRGI